MSEQREIERLAQTRALVDDRFGRFGVNKRREVVRLIYEISKRDRVSPGEVVSPGNNFKFGDLKKTLLAKRYPVSAGRGNTFRPYLPAFTLNAARRRPDLRADFYPREVFIEQTAVNTGMVDRFRKSFPDADFTEIKSLKEYLRVHRGDEFGYSQRKERVFLVGEKHDFFKRCPCTRRSVPCGYHIFNLAFGCIFECTYCYLQEYSNTPGLIFPVNLDGYFDRFRAYHDSGAARNWQRGSKLRIGTGEFSDSLMLDQITEYSAPLIEYFGEFSDVEFEFKTKSDNIARLLRIQAPGNIVVGWSLNPERMIDENEFLSASLVQRLDAAGKCSRAGYRTAFHFDPIFYYQGWRNDYREVIERLFQTVWPEAVAWLSLGTLRFTPPLKKIIETRFPNNSILDAEMILGYDDKLRYPASIRFQIYRFMIDELQKQSKDLPIYLCMENKKMWDELNLSFPFY